MINLLFHNNFYPVISYRRVQKESDELLYTLWSLVMVRNQLPAQVVNLFVPKLQYFLSFRYILSITQTKQIINLLLHNNFYPVIYRRVQKESDELLYTVWSLVMVRKQLPAQVVKTVEQFFFYRTNVEY